MILLDTHAVIWLVTDDDALGPESRRLACQAAAMSDLAISAISLWEVGMLIAKSRLRWDRSAQTLREIILGAGVIELPVTGDIALLGTSNYP